MLMETEPQKCRWFSNGNGTTMHVMILHDILVLVCTVFFFFFQKNYMSKKANWDFLKLVQGRYYYSSLMDWLGSQAGSWDPRKYPSQILSPLVVQQFSQILLTRFQLKARLKVCGLLGACSENSEKEWHKADHNSKWRKTINAQNHTGSRWHIFP